MPDIEISRYAAKVKAMHEAEAEFIETKIKELEILEKYNKRR